MRIPTNISLGLRHILQKIPYPMPQHSYPPPLSESLKLRSRSDFATKDAIKLVLGEIVYAATKSRSVGGDRLLDRLISTEMVNLYKQ